MEFKCGVSAGVTAIAIVAGSGGTERMGRWRVSVRWLEMQCFGCTLQFLQLPIGDIMIFGKSRIVNFSAKSKKFLLAFQYLIKSSPYQSNSKQAYAKSENFFAGFFVSCFCGILFWQVTCPLPLLPIVSF